jgi:hypothetical protein
MLERPNAPFALSVRRGVMLWPCGGQPRYLIYRRGSERNLIVMRKRFVLLAVVLAVVVGLLTAATYVTTRDHMTLHGDKTSRQISGVFALASAPKAPRPGVPANATVTKLTLHGDRQNH